MHPKLFEIVRLCVQTGVRNGWNEAHEELESPDEEQIQEAIEQAIIDELHEYFEFDGLE